MNKPLLSVALAVVLFFSVLLNAYFYLQNQTEQQSESNLGKQINDIRNQLANLTLTLPIGSPFNESYYEVAAYYNEFGTIPASYFAYPFSPPISMYYALQIGLETDGWNKTSLQGMVVGVSLVHGQTGGNESVFGTGIDAYETTPPANYSNIYDNGTIYRYMWEIIVNNATAPTRPPRDFILVDTTTGWVLPKPLLW